jgi:hypothetical protein
MPRSSVRSTQASQPFKSELRRGPKGTVYLSIAPTGRRNGRTRLGLNELVPEGRNYLLNLEGQKIVNAALDERKKKVYESKLAPT